MFKKFPINKPNSSTPKPTPSSKEIVKELHHECYKIINEAILQDEQNVQLSDKRKAIELYNKGIKKLDQALAIKFKSSDLDEKSKMLIEKMKGNRTMVLERLDALNTMILESRTKRLCRLSSTNKINSQPRDRPFSSNFFKGRTTTTTESTLAKVRGDNIRNGLPNSESNRTLSNSTSLNLDNLKHIDKKILDVILDNLYKPNSSFKFESISGLRSAKQALKEIVIWPMMNPELFTGLRQPSRAVLFFGPPGCGKTLLAKALANECQANFLSITASSLTSKWLGESEKLVKALFSVARHLKPCILFIDEIDSLLSERKENESEATRRLKTEFFIELDGLKSDENDQVFILAATNVPQNLDEAALRRFPKRIFINLPDSNGRKELFLKLLSQQENQLKNSEVDKLAELTEGYSASDIMHLCKDAALQPLREIEADKIKNLKPKNIRKIKFEDFEGSLKRIRKSCVESSVEKLKKWSSQYGDNSEQSSN